MSQKDPIRVFVTHAWKDTDDYIRVFEYLESSRNFFYKTTSTPDVPPRSGDAEVIREELRRQIEAAEVVIALATLYVENPDYTIYQMNHAQSKKIPVVLMRTFGSRKEVPPLLAERANEICEWEGRGMVDAIRKLARGENTARFESVDFNPDDFKDFKLD